MSDSDDCQPGWPVRQTDDEEWLDDNLEYVEYVKEQYQNLVDEKNK